MALLDKEPRSADAIAIKPSEVFVLSREDFLSFLHSDTDAVDSILSSLSKRLRKTDDLLEDICFLSISERFKKLISRLGKAYGKEDGAGVVIDIVLTQKEFGDMIGATRESINREIKALREQGLIEMVDNRIKIIDLSLLEHEDRRY